MLACACGAAAWAVPLGWAVGTPATVFALAWGWKHSGIEFDPYGDTITTTTTTVAEAREEGDQAGRG